MESVQISPSPSSLSLLPNPMTSVSWISPREPPSLLIQWHNLSSDSVSQLLLSQELLTDLQLLHTCRTSSYSESQVQSHPLSPLGALFAWPSFPTSFPSTVPTGTLHCSWVTFGVYFPVLCFYVLFPLHSYFRLCRPLTVSASSSSLCFTSL